MKRVVLSVLALTSVALAAIACDSSSDTPHDVIDSGVAHDSGSGDSASSDSGSSDAGPTCVMNPRTHVEIINACTDAQSFDKNPRLPLLQPDGSLPPLP